ncbi:SusC/RagA family TonB-linked outer membrane protein [Alistipes sp. OttesenSCG-928-B03]|nr:SusC/RagA family TonB-linked outer membrane protein [Alistipes sp. OttesenSCG-928-B03]
MGKTDKRYYRFFLLLLTGWLCSGTLYGAGSEAAGASASEATVETTQNPTTIVRGVVVDQSGVPLVGVAVVVKGTTIGTSTDARGAFTLSIPAAGGAKTLVFSYIGYATREIASDSKALARVQMTEDVNKIEEVVVTGYQTIDRKLFTGAASVVRADQLESDGANDISRMLQGKAAGVAIQNVSGTFGAAPKLKIRGSSSIFGEMKPLWVVDGVVLEDVVEVSADELSSGDATTLISSAVAGLNGDDIESFQILKDAAATALYGARAMNGVIVITTKKGKKGNLNLRYSGEYSIRQVPSYREYNVMNSQQQMAVYLDLEDKGWLNYVDIKNGSNGGVYRKMYDAMSQLDANGNFLVENTQEGRNAFLQKYEKINTNWFKTLFRPSLQQNHSLSITTGLEKARFYASISYFGDPGWSPTDDVKRFTANVNASVDIKPWITLNMLTNASMRLQKAPGTLSRTVDAEAGSISRAFDINPFSYALNSSRVLRPYDDEGNYEYYTMNYAPFNILDELENNTIDVEVLDSRFQAELDINPTSKLNVKLMGSARYVKTSQEHQIRDKSNMSESYRADYNTVVIEANRNLYRDPDNITAVPLSVLPQGGFYTRRDNTLLNYYFRAMVNYSNVFSGNHTLNVLAGAEVKDTKRDYSEVYGYGMQYDRGYVPYVDYRILKNIIERGSGYFNYTNYKDRFAAMFLNAGYSFDGRYTLNGTVRYDGSNRMGKSMTARWLPTWNVSGAWHVREEKWLGGDKWLSRFTIRATYGLTANMGPATNSAVVYRNAVPFRPVDYRENGIYIQELENSDITWEKQYELNVGVDLGLFNNRVSFIFDVYKRNGFDLIGRMRSAGLGGKRFKFANYADMTSHGFEFTLNTRNIQNDNFKWATTLTFSYNKNKITNLYTNPRVIDLLPVEGYPREGYPVRGLYSIPFAGLNSEGMPILINENGVETVGEINFEEVEKHDFLVYEGPVDPKMIGGFDNTFNWRNFKAGLFFTYQFGSKLRLYPAFSSRYSDLMGMGREFADRWMLPGDENITNVPAIPTARDAQRYPYLQRAFNAYNYSNVRVAKGDFIRLKDVYVTYDFPKKWLTGLKLSNVSVRAAVSNVCLLLSDKKLKGQDPEFVRSGGVALPIPRQYTFTLKFGF